MLGEGVPLYEGRTFFEIFDQASWVFAHPDGRLLSLTKETSGLTRLELVSNGAAILE